MWIISDDNHRASAWSVRIVLLVFTTDSRTKRLCVLLTASNSCHCIGWHTIPSRCWFLRVFWRILCSNDQWIGVCVSPHPLKCPINDCSWQPQHYSQRYLALPNPGSRLNVASDRNAAIVVCYYAHCNDGEIQCDYMYTVTIFRGASCKVVVHTAFLWSDTTATIFSTLVLGQHLFVC